ncbi:MAG: AAA family ATPase [Rhodospirillum sp.]|nr:AAA family ATPase [Rhodospirillum sp.]MCF8489841.1 AAA family ATPase [Rhodospirillum sp.]MCF8499664.1 AAA family ATPase [Rhodospirillum sp.]
MTFTRQTFTAPSFTSPPFTTEIRTAPVAAVLDEINDPGRIRPRDPLLAHWSLRHHPFPVDPGLDLAFSTGTDRDPARRLIARIHGDPRPTLVLGEAGLGKTYLARWVAAVLRRRDTVIRLSARTLDADGLLATVCRALDLDPHRRGGMGTRVIRARLLAMGLGGRRVILMVDDAEALTERGTLDLFHLDSLETKRGRLLRMVLLGRPEIRIPVTQCPPLRARLGSAITLKPLTREEGATYFNQRLEQALPQATGDQGPPSPFTPAAKRLLLRESLGVPGILDTLAARCLDLALADGSPQVETGHARMALRVLGLARSPALALLFPWRGSALRDPLAGSLAPCPAPLSS